MPHSPADRSFERFADEDLARLAELAARDRSDRFRRKPRWSAYADRARKAVVLLDPEPLRGQVVWPPS